MTRHTSPFRIYRRALLEARAYWPWLTVVLLLGLAAIPLGLLAPLPFKLVVDSVLDSQPLPAWLDSLLPAWATTGTETIFWMVIALSVLVAVLGIIHQAVDWLVREYVAERMVLDFRGRLFLHALHASLLHHTARGSHEPAYRIAQDAPALQWTALYGFIPVIISLVSLTAMLYVTGILAPQLALVALATSVPLVLLIHFNQVRMRDRWHGVREHESAAQSVVREALDGLRIVSVFGQQRREQSRFLRRARQALWARLRVIRMEGGFTIVLGLATALGTTAILYLGVRDVQGGALTTGELLLIMGYIGQLYAPLQAIGTHITSQQRAIASAERAFAILDEETNVPERPDALPLERAEGRFSFHDVGFAYPGNEPVLSGVNLEVPPGSRVGVVGPSGAGKSTFINLLLRLFDPGTGGIQLDGVDLRDYKLADLRHQFSVVSQDVILFSSSIAENIAYARPEATPEEVEAAARLANAHEFIRSLPEGYATQVGDRGMRLSGGERQRISLARAFLKDAPILLLDEPTSSLDKANETAITECIDRLMQGRTVFIIAHHAGVLRDVDGILRIQHGHVTQEACPAHRLELLKAG